MSNPFFEFGAILAASRRDISREELQFRKGAAAVMDSPEAAPFHRELCKIATAAYSTAGEPAHPHAILFRNLSQAEDWYPEYRRFTDPIRRGLAKNATSLLPAVAALHDKAGGGIMKTLTAGGALGGAALGSLAFLLTRNAQQSSAENTALLEKVKAYKQLKRDIEEDMNSTEAMATAKAPARGGRYDV